MKSNNQNLKQRTKRTKENGSTTRKLDRRPAKSTQFSNTLTIKKYQPTKGVPTAVAKELQPFLDQEQVQGMEQTDDSVYYDSNSEADKDDEDEDNDNTFQDAIQVEDVIEDTDDDCDATTYGEPINNDFVAPAGTEAGATGVTIEHKGILHAQYCQCGELYYQSCKIYGDDPTKTKETIDMLAHSGELWSLCDNASSFQVNPMLCHCSEIEYNQHVIERNQRLTYQGVLDNCKDVGMTEAELQQAQVPLNPSIRRPEMKD